MNTTDDQPAEPSSYAAEWFGALFTGAELPAAPARDESLDVFAALLGATDPTTTTDNPEGTLT